MGNLSFAKTVNDRDDFMPKGRSDCFDYGSWYGCNCSCPVFRQGKCKVEDKKAFLEMIKNDNDLDEETSERLIKMYSPENNNLSLLTDYFKNSRFLIFTILIFRLL